LQFQILYFPTETCCIEVLHLEYKTAFAENAGSARVRAAAERLTRRLFTARQFARYGGDEVMLWKQTVRQTSARIYKPFAGEQTNSKAIPYLVQGPQQK